MKKLILLVLLMAPGLDWGSGLFLNHAAAADAAGERVGERPAYAYHVERRIDASDVKNRNNGKQLLADGPVSEAEARRLKLILLLMMSLGQYRAPAY